MKATQQPDYAWCNKAQLDEYIAVRSLIMSQNKINSMKCKTAEDVIFQAMLEADK